MSGEGALSSTALSRVPPAAGVLLSLAKEACNKGPPPFFFTSRAFHFTHFQPLIFILNEQKRMKCNEAFCHVPPALEYRLSSLFSLHACFRVFYLFRFSKPLWQTSTKNCYIYIYFLAPSSKILLQCYIIRVYNIKIYIKTKILNLKCR